ncbi:DUF3408 domain-containing protein [uncultured Duncaniella sp.]|nr:DUF3408 domain-containing protein [uncultured Duncaniella sp.]
MFFKKKRKPKPEAVIPPAENSVKILEAANSGTAVKDELFARKVNYIVRYISRNRIDAPRKGIFVNRELVHKLADYVHIISQGEASIGAYVEEIILDHINRNKEILDALFEINHPNRL